MFQHIVDYLKHGPSHADGSVLYVNCPDPDAQTATNL